MQVRHWLWVAASVKFLIPFAARLWPSAVKSAGDYFLPCVSDAIEQQYQELKTELGLDHFEGRTFPGWHHHVVLTAIAYNFLQAERRRNAAALTFPAIRGIVQEIFTAHLLAQRPQYLTRIEALRSVQLRI